MRTANEKRKCSQFQHKRLGWGLNVLGGKKKIKFKVLLLLPSLGVLAMEALHRQVLPFLLRRMKEDVLQDLPPKIIQDYYCILSPLQVCLKSGWKLSFFSTVKTTEEPLPYSWVNLMSALTLSGTTGLKVFLICV